MMYEMRRQPEPTLLPTQGIFNLQHHMGMVWEELVFDDAVSSTYTKWGKWNAAQLNVIARIGIRTPVPRVTYPTL